MVLMFAPLVAGLSSGHKIGLVVVAAAFIVFALVSAFVLPARYPDFPGRGIGLYSAIAVLFFAAMVAAVLVFGKESKEAASAEPTPTATVQTTTNGGGASTQGSTTQGSATQGDPVAGKAVFASAGCSGCHTLKAAGSTGNVGPNLDQLKPAYATVVHQVENGGGVMPAFKSQLSQTQIDDVSAFVATSTH
jgi:mono/diheme cytochrome c family protein